MARSVFALVAGLALAIPSVANAVVIDLSSSAVNDGGASYWTRVTTFALPAGFTNAVLNITKFVADDRAVVRLNGTVIDATGIFGPGQGAFNFTPNDPSTPYTFTLGNDSSRNINITSGFSAGTNSLEFIVNDTFDGIRGELFNGADGPAGPTQYGFSGTVNFGAVPEPATWAMMILGFGFVGGAMRYRTRGTKVAFAA